MSEEISPLNTARHIKYFKMCLTALPSRAQKQDSNKLLLIYCSVCALSLLGYEFTAEEKKDISAFIYLHYVPTGEGFRGSLTHKLQPWNRYDPGTLANTYSALCILITLGDEYRKKLDSEAIMKYIKSTQIENGSFLSILDIDGKPFGDGDLRQCYLAASIRKLLQYPANGVNDFDVDKMQQYIISSRAYDGGLGTQESHAGLTFCGLAALKLTNRIDGTNWDTTIDWLAHRQIFYDQYNSDLLQYDYCDDTDQGGHNGRANKYADTCYSFWCAGSLSLLNASQFIDRQLACRYLLNVTQNQIIGGFSKTDADDPDPYHAYLGLAALSLLKFEGLKELDTMLVIPKDASSVLSS
ncbi:hypothetical protein WICPIJ_010077 [Wickerhamomyces pijperi]|uniref:Prenyltransferase alpha-alpha toroid domain-containing protein n=1 Tax=Wickerhamomyces pijperi TaxID=599730 RepID=A0A9P8PIG0_WICPI|nr:hypothetical protein WICPIJ_010077 [Wickerhamomyces pijperi]